MFYALYNGHYDFLYHLEETLITVIKKVASRSSELKARESLAGRYGAIDRPRSRTALTASVSYSTSFLTIHPMSMIGRSARYLVSDGISLTIICAFNAFVRIASSALLFKSEVIVHPRDVHSYIDAKECQLSYNPILTVAIWEALATHSIDFLRHTYEIEDYRR